MYKFKRLPASKFVYSLITNKIKFEPLKIIVIWNNSKKQGQIRTKKYFKSQLKKQRFPLSEKSLNINNYVSKNF